MHFKRPIGQLFGHRAQSRKGFSVVELTMCIGILGVLTCLLASAVQATRVLAREMECKSRLAQLGIALHDYAGAHGRLPDSLKSPWTFAVAKRLNSVESFGVDGQSSPLARYLRCPSASDTDQVDSDVINYALNFEVNDLRMEHITDGTTSTILTSELAIDFGARLADGPMIMVGALNANHGDHVNVGFCDGSVRALSKNVSVDVIERMITPQGSEITPILD
jgi:prepilin-type processing-associated H-X9-DG protein